jgi:hypothetical protein
MSAGSVNGTAAALRTPSGGAADATADSAAVSLVSDAGIDAVFVIVALVIRAAGKTARGDAPRSTSRRRTPTLGAPVIRTATLLVVTMTIMACDADRSATDPAATAIVKRLIESPSPQRWDFSYQTDSASPYSDCLGGLDAVSGAIDLDVGVLRLAPRRTAPSLMVTRTSLLIDNAQQSNRWLEVELDADVDQAHLVGVFGEVLGGYVVTGLQAPNLKTTVLAAIDIASSVDIARAPFGLAGDAIEITLDPDLYLDELSAEGVALTNEDRNRIPTITAVVDAPGRVTELVVDPAAASPESADVEHRGRYMVSATYDNLDSIAVPNASSRDVVGIDDVNYPRPNESCALGS